MAQRREGQGESFIRPALWLVLTEWKYSTWTNCQVISPESEFGSISSSLLECPHAMVTGTSGSLSRSVSLKHGIKVCSNGSEGVE